MNYIGIIDKVASGSYFMPMRAVGLKVLKNRLSEYIRLASGGETILVTDRDRVVAELVPPDRARSRELSDALLAGAVRNGWLTPPLMPQAGAPPRLPVKSFRILMRELQQDREER